MVGAVSLEYSDSRVSWVFDFLIASEITLFV